MEYKLLQVDFYLSMILLNPPKHQILYQEDILIIFILFKLNLARIAGSP